jgi:hypothetical protein
MPAPDLPGGTVHLFSGPGVMFLEDLLDPVGRHLRIDLRRGDIGMTEHLLDRPEVRPSFE